MKRDEETQKFTLVDDVLLKSFYVWHNKIDFEPSNWMAQITRRATIAEGPKVREKEGSSQLLGVVCRANSQQIVISRNKLNINAP